MKILQIFHYPPGVPPLVLNATIFIIAVDPVDITADVLDDVALVPVSICTTEIDTKILDSAAVIQMLSPKLTKTFQEDVDLIFLHTSSDSLKL
jgi:hypothetical protein